MSIAPRVFGLATVQPGTGQGDALENLGYTRNGVEFTNEAFTSEIPGDQNGGDEGPPVDIQYLGEIVRVRAELTKWDDQVADRVIVRVKGETAGVTPTPGVLLFAAEKYMPLAISTPLKVITFPRAVPRQPIEHNRGTKHSVLVVEFECHMPPGGGEIWTISDPV